VAAAAALASSISLQFSEFSGASAVSVVASHWRHAASARLRIGIASVVPDNLI
jgi:hypothetical protein